MFGLGRLERQLQELESILAQRFGDAEDGDALARLRTSLDSDVEQYNQWVERESSRLEEQKQALDAAIEELRQMESGITELDEKLAIQPAADDPQAMARYAECVHDRNAAVERYNAAADRLKQQRETFNHRVEQFNREAARRKREVEGAQREALSKTSDYNRWLSNQGPQEFFRRVNRLYADSLPPHRRAAGRDNAVADAVQRLRAMRRKLGEYARQQQRTRDDEMVIVEARLCDGEPCHFIVDIAASFVSISPELVAALELHDHVGEEVELSLAGGIQIRAPQLLIPKLAVGEHEAAHIKGVVLQENMCGVDGLLGLSFLNRFAYRIVRNGESELLLQAREPVPQAASFDVFISFKSEVEQAARTVYEVLTRRGYSVFFSAVTLQEVGQSNYQRAIDDALESARHFVLICGSGQQALTPYVRAEWEMYETLVRAGEKDGNIVSVLCGRMKERELPLSLRRYQAISINQPGWEDALEHFLPR